MNGIMVAFTICGVWITAIVVLEALDTRREKQAKRLTDDQNQAINITRGWPEKTRACARVHPTGAAFCHKPDAHIGNHYDPHGDIDWTPYPVEGRRH